MSYGHVKPVIHRATGTHLFTPSANACSIGGMCEMRTRTVTNPHGAGRHEGDPYDASSTHRWLNGRYVFPWDIVTCPRCGRDRRRAGRKNTPDICVDCRSVEQPHKRLVASINRSNDIALEGGHWVRDGLIWRWQRLEEGAA